MFLFYRFSMPYFYEPSLDACINRKIPKSLLVLVYDLFLTIKRGVIVKYKILILKKIWMNEFDQNDPLLEKVRELNTEFSAVLTDRKGSLQPRAPDF